MRFRKPSAYIYERALFVTCATSHGKDENDEVWVVSFRLFGVPLVWVGLISAF